MNRRTPHAGQSGPGRRPVSLLLVAATALAALATMAGCGVGEDAPTLDVQPDNPGADVGPVQVRSMMLLSPPDGGDGAAVVTLVNTSDESQTLDTVEVGPRAGNGSAIEVAAGIRIPANGAVNVGAAGQPTLPVTDLADIGDPGALVPVTLVFDKAGRVTLDVFIREATGPYASFLPTESPPG